MTGRADNPNGELKSYITGADSKALNTLDLTVAVIVSQRSDAVVRNTRQLKVEAETCTAIATMCTPASSGALPVSLR